MQEHFDQVASGVEQSLSEAGPEDLVARKLLTLHTARLGSRLFAGSDPVAWCGVLVPFELLNAMGIASAFTEFVGATLAGTGAAGAFVDLAEQSGYPTDACTYHRTVLGATAGGLMPEPHVLVATSTPCAGGVAVLEEMARRFARPFHVLHVPYGEGDKDVHHLAAQLREMVGVVESATGRRLDTDRLRAAIELSNRARAALVRTYELARTVPTPARRRDLINLAFVISMLLGTDAAVEVAEAYRDELGRKVELGVSGVPGERLRLLWFQNRVQFRSGLEEMLEERGAAVVVDELNDVTWPPIDPDDPFPGLARRMLSTPLTGPVDRRVRHLQELARVYRVDGAVHPCHWGCRQGTGARGLIADGLREVAVPMLSLEVDCVDQRSFGEGQIRTRVEAFLEMLLTHRATVGAS